MKHEANKHTITTVYDMYVIFMRFCLFFITIQSAASQEKITRLDLGTSSMLHAYWLTDVDEINPLGI